MTVRAGWMGSLGGCKQDTHSRLAWTEEQEEQLCLLSGRQGDRQGLDVDKLMMGTLERRGDTENGLQLPCGEYGSSLSKLGMWQKP